MNTQDNIFIMGGKKTEQDVLEYSSTFSNRVRCNMNVQGEIDMNKDIFYLNNHVYDNWNIHKLNIGKKYNFMSKDVIKKFVSTLSETKIKPLKQKYSGTKGSNIFLKKIKCDKIFKNQPRCGYQSILHFIENNKFPVVSGFTIDENEKQLTYGGREVTDFHDTKSEIKVFKWLHDHSFIDITPCMYEKDTLPLLNCYYMKPRIDFMVYCLKKHGICILKNYYNEDSLSKIINESDKIFTNKSDKIEILDKEGCSKDERIFYAEKHSQTIKNLFSDDKLFNDIAKIYNPNLNKKTLINKLVFEEAKIKNSGAGWHRDNHNCQFKAIMYLTDVESKNGCFRYITNSNKKHIGKPNPRTVDYDTRFTDETIKQVIKDNDKCNIIDVTGKKGTIILADTTYIHRGKIIEEGERKAITQYFF